MIYGRIHGLQFVSGCFPSFCCAGRMCTASFVCILFFFYFDVFCAWILYINTADPPAACSSSSFSDPSLRLVFLLLLSFCSSCFLTSVGSLPCCYNSTISVSISSSSRLVTFIASPWCIRLLSYHHLLLLLWFTIVHSSYIMVQSCLLVVSFLLSFTAESFLYLPANAISRQRLFHLVLPFCSYFSFLFFTDSFLAFSYQCVVFWQPVKPRD